MEASDVSTPRVQPKRSAKKSQKKKGRTSSHLEKLVSKTQKLKVDELLDLYKVYDNIVVDLVFRLLLLPYTRFARTWLRDQVRDLLAGTDRNRLIMTSRARKTAEADYDALSPTDKAARSKTIKTKHQTFSVGVLRMLHKLDTTGAVPTVADLRSLGVSRLVFDDMGNYVYAVMNSYPGLVADWCSAKAAGDVEDLLEIEGQMRALELEIGIKRDVAWYVTLNLRSAYDQIDKMVQLICMGFSRLLFRFSHQLRGVTTTEENFSAGYEGLMRAARNYDPIDGSSFTAHCQWWVRSAVLQRQRQASIILLPNTTWYQLSLLQKGNTDLTSERVSDLKERAEMFYANSANAARSLIDSDEGDDFSFESVRVTSPDAPLVMGDALTRSQATDDVYESANLQLVGGQVLEEIISLIYEEDPSLLFPVLLWAMNSGIDTTMLAEATAPLFLTETKTKDEQARHQNIKQHQQTLHQNTKNKKVHKEQIHHGISQESSEESR